MNPRFIIPTVLVGLMVLTGCPLLEGQFGKSRPTTEMKRDQANLAAANKAFRNGRYEKARALFTATQHAQDADLARQALYGLACTQLAAAKTPQEFKQGMELWANWTELRDPRLTGEDPRLLAGMLPRMKPKPEPDRTAQSRDADKKPSKDQIRKLIQAHRKQNEVLEAKIALLEKEIRVLSYFEEYSVNLEMEIQTLRHQIQTLQAIDQNIQQKKQEISAQ